METSLEAKVSVTINASVEAVWKAITTPALIKEYLMGTHVESDWKVGSSISYEGEYNGKKYKDKGTIKKLDPERVFQSTYWSSMGGKEDKPENYNLVTYNLEQKSEEDNLTLLTLTQDNVLSDKELNHVSKNWEQVLKKLKEVAETMM